MYLLKESFPFGGIFFSSYPKTFGGNIELQSNVIGEPSFSPSPFFYFFFFFRILFPDVETWLPVKIDLADGPRSPFTVFFFP